MFIDKKSKFKKYNEGDLTRIPSQRRNKKSKMLDKEERFILKLKKNKIK